MALLIHAILHTLALASNLTYIDPKFHPAIGSLPANSIPYDPPDLDEVKPPLQVKTTTLAPTVPTTSASREGKSVVDHVEGDYGDDSEYLKLGKETLDEIKGLMDQPEGWKLARRARSGITVKYLFHPKYNRRIFLTEAEMPAPPEILNRVIWSEGGTMDEWNESIEDVEILKLIGDTAQISRQVAANEAGGIVSQRDFVVLNQRDEEDSPLGKIYYVAYISIEYPDRPPLEDFVRAENGPSGFRFEPIEDKPGFTRVLWVFNADLKFDHMPSTVLNAVLPASTINYMKYLKTHLEKMKERGDF